MLLERETETGTYEAGLSLGIRYEHDHGMTPKETRPRPPGPGWALCVEASSRVLEGYVREASVIAVMAKHGRTALAHSCFPRSRSALEPLQCLYYIHAFIQFSIHRLGSIERLAPGRIKLGPCKSCVCASLRSPSATYF